MCKQISVPCKSMHWVKGKQQAAVPRGTSSSLSAYHKRQEVMRNPHLLALLMCPRKNVKKRITKPGSGKSHEPHTMSHILDSAECFHKRSFNLIFYIQKFLHYCKLYLHKKKVKSMASLQCFIFGF